MKKSQRMLPIKNLAESHEDQAANLLGQSRQTLSQEQSRLEELKQYRQQYLQGFNNAGKNGMSGTQLQHYQRFIQQLDVAIAAQEQRIAQLSQQCEQARHHWQQKHHRTQALDKTVQRYQSHERYQQERKEQREIEDNLQSRYVRNK
ncbi:MAG: flagellar export protein FliJ [Thioalkalispiraceae bacterium]|jgi:flagellar FliJ protein